MRVVRKWLTARLTDVALVAAPRLRPGVIDVFESLLARGGRYCPVVRQLVARNMQAVGVYTPQAHRDYFTRAAAHLAGQLHILRNAPHAGGAPGAGMPEQLARVVRDRIQLDASFDRLRQAASGGQGVIIMAPHVVDLPLWLARLNQEVPLSVYMRDSKDPMRRFAKQQWYRTAGCDAIVESSGNRNALDSGEADRASGRRRLIEALRQRRVVVITPDIPQKDPKGKPVRFFDREICLPRGAAILSRLTSAPLMTMVARPAGPAIRLVLHGPFSAHVGTGPERSASRPASVQQRLQWFTDCFVDFLRAYPSLWFFWGDKRWGRVFRGDPRYVRSAGASVSPNRTPSAMRTAGAT